MSSSDSSPTSPTLRPTVFYQALLGSGLVDGLVLHRLVSEVSAAGAESDEEQDRLCATRLIESERLNPWQIDQLSRGRTKFTLGPYRVIDAIAGGGMGHVFKGEHELLGRVEAIKVLPRAKSSPEAIASFRHEIRAQAQLDHPNLVRVSYADRDGDTYFFVTEYVPGIDLRRLIRRRGALDEAMAAVILSQAAEAIDYAHRRGLVHRDVKPGNLLLTPDAHVKVTDLGLAWYLEEEQAGPTPQGRGKVVGTSDYLAPEAIRNPDRILPVSDLYGLGCTLYYTLTGKVPFPGGTHMQKMRRHLQEEPTDPRRWNAELSDTMHTLVNSLMAKSPSARPASAADVAEALRPLADDAAVERLAALVQDTVADRNRRHAFSPSDGDSSTARAPADDLPETVGLPIDVPALLIPPERSASDPSPSANDPPPLPSSISSGRTSDGGNQPIISPTIDAYPPRRRPRQPRRDNPLRWITYLAILASVAIAVLSILKQLGS